MIRNEILLVLLLLLTSSACENTKEVNLDRQQEATRTKIEMTTTKGKIVLALYNETPKHRDNFIKIVNDGVLDSLLFHRVINQFMVQAGDINSKDAPPNIALGNGDLNYMVDAEILPEFYHKRGAIGAARGDNPERASSSTQFYIVQRGPRNDSLINIDENRINGWLAEHYMQKDSSYTSLFQAKNHAIANEDRDMYLKVIDSITNLAKGYTNFKRYTIPSKHREVYNTIGGTPHLDQNYTVFGEVVKGMNIIDSIAVVATNDLDRPIEDIRILNLKIIEE